MANVARRTHRLQSRASYAELIVRRARPVDRLREALHRPRRHCEPTGRANARPMTGSAKQSILPRKERMDCFAALAMTWRRLAVTSNTFTTSPRAFARP